MSKYLCLVSLLLAVATVNSEMFTSKLMSSKTKYEDVSTKDLALPDDFTPLKAFFLIRHATGSSTHYVNIEMRKGLKKVQDKIKENAEAAKMSVEEYAKALGKDVEEFMQWNTAPIPYNGKTLDEDLSSFGRYQMTGFGYRMKSKLHKIFGHVYDPDMCRILSLNNARSRKSGQVFFETVYPRYKLPWDDIEFTERDDYTLNMEDLKKKDPKFSEYNKKWEEQEQAYKDSELFKEVRQRFANKLGFSLDEVNYELVQSFWEICRWDRVTFDAVIVPCKLISVEDHEILLYYDTLFWFNFIDPAANPFNYTLSCGVVHNLLEFLKSDLSGPKSALFFGNRSNIAALYFALGLVNEKEPFSTSRTMPFMANFVVILLEHDNHPEEGLWVSFYLNEQRLEVPMPDDRKYEIAPLSLVVTKLEDYLASYCDVNGEKPLYKIPDFSRYYDD